MRWFQLDETRPEKAIYYRWPFWKYKDIAAWCLQTRGKKIQRTVGLMLTTLLGSLLFFLIKPISIFFTFQSVYAFDLAIGLGFLIPLLFISSQFFYPIIFVDPKCFGCFAQNYVIQRERLHLLGHHTEEEIDKLVLRQAELQKKDLQMQYINAFRDSQLCPICPPFQEMFEQLQLPASIPKYDVDDYIMQEWDVARRTAEFFDGILGNLRTYGLTASVTLIGLAFQFQVAPLLLAGFCLNIGLLFVDKRYQSYLRATALYSIKLENEYNFADTGLAHAINDEREKNWLSRPEHTFRVIYVVLAIASFLGFLSRFFLRGE
jgi:hypothetical protein